MTTDALSPLYTALYARLNSLSGLGSVHVGTAPPDAAEPYAILAADTQAEAVFFADRDGVPADATVTVNVWDRDKLGALDGSSAVIASLRVTPLAVAGFGLLSATLDGSFSLADTDGAPLYGQANRFRFILSPN